MLHKTSLETISAEKHSSLLGPFVSEENDYSGLYYKSFAIVIYDRNGRTIVEPLL